MLIISKSKKEEKVLILQEPSKGSNLRIRSLTVEGVVSTWN
jgi:hypothetical protein